MISVVLFVFTAMMSWLQCVHWKTVTGVLAHDHPSNGETYFLIFHQAVLIPNLKVSLLSLMQMLNNDLFVNDKPKSMALTPTNNHHCITIHWHLGHEGALWIPLSIHGATSYFPMRKPTREDAKRQRGARRRSKPRMSLFYWLAA
jgi:hypothetical protein